MNFLLYTIKIHNSNTKKCANSVISFEPYSNIVFSKEVQIWIVQNYSSDKGLTQLRRDYIVNFTITNKKIVPVVEVFKRVIAENFAKGISRDTRLRVADTFCTRAKICIQEEGGHFEYLLKKKK